MVSYSYCLLVSVFFLLRVFVLHSIVLKGGAFIMLNCLKKSPKMHCSKIECVCNIRINFSMVSKLKDSCTIQKLSFLKKYLYIRYFASFWSLLQYSDSKAYAYCAMISFGFFECQVEVSLKFGICEKSSSLAAGVRFVNFQNSSLRSLISCGQLYNINFIKACLVMHIFIREIRNLKPGCD